jgi:hypothetical protein
MQIQIMPQCVECQTHEQVVAPSIVFVNLSIDNPLKSLILILFSEPAFAEGGFSFYFFGQNIKSFQDSNWMEVAVGAFASVCIHELSHALYLDSRGKAWHLDASVSSGFAIRADENMTDPEMRNFGGAGFAIQSLVGTGLTVFRQTRDLGFSKGWVAMNAVQVVSYQSRRHGSGDDFALIDQGGSDRKLEFAAFSLLSVNNLKAKMNLLYIRTADFQ